MFIGARKSLGRDSILDRVLCFGGSTPVFFIDCTILFDADQHNKLEKLRLATEGAVSDLQRQIADLRRHGGTAKNPRRKAGGNRRGGMGVMLRPTERFNNLELANSFPRFQTGRLLNLN